MSEDDRASAHRVADAIKAYNDGNRYAYARLSPEDRERAVEASEYIAQQRRRYVAISLAIMCCVDVVAGFTLGYLATIALAIAMPLAWRVIDRTHAR